MNVVLSEDLVSVPSNNSTYYDYALYGLRVRARVKLTLDDIPVEGSADVELLPGDPEQFADAISHIILDDSDWIHLHELPGGWSYLRYDELFEFLVEPSGSRVFYRFLATVSLESFQTYALGRVFSFALVKLGYEPLHAATIVVDGRAVAFLGASTFGKSSLATCFVAAGYPLLTDDTLRLEERGGQYVAFPGPPRLRLMPRIARLYLGGTDAGVVMNPREKNAKAPKLVFCLSPSQSFANVAPLAAIYVITAPRKVHRRQRIMIGSLPSLQAMVNVLSFTHNAELSDAKRLSRQLEAAQKLITSVRMRSLSYPRVLSSLADVRDAVLADLKN